MLAVDGRIMAGDSVLTAIGVAMRFGGVNAVDGVSMRLARRELRCLIGPNGAGKSTFFKCLSGQYRPTEGDILLDGESIVGLEKHAIARRGVGVKTQVPSLMNALTVEENLWLAARAVRTRKPADVAARVGELIDTLALGAVARHAVDALAHGQRQVVELGVVLAPDPWLILLDEPAGGLTHAEVERMAGLVAELATRATVVVVEHDMHFVRQIAHAVTVFHRGKILVEGSAEQVLADARVLDVYLGRRR